MSRIKKAVAVIMAVMLAVTGMSLSAFAVDSLYETPFDNSRWYEMGDYTLHYRVFENKAPYKGQIMFIHGFGLSTASFEQMVPYFTEAGYRCALVDVPNMGYSTRETRDTQLLSREELVYSLMTQLSDESWILAGHSMGGGIAVNIAVAHPEMISSLLLYCPQTSKELSFPADSLMRSALMTALFEGIIKLGCRSSLIMSMLVKSMLQDDDVYDSYDVSSISAPLSIDGTGAGMAVMASHAVGPNYEAISALTQPTLIIEGEIDIIASAENIEALESAMNTDTVETVSGAGHMLIQTRAQEASQLSLSYLERLGG